MKRVLSLLMLIAMLVSLFVFSPAALATGDTPTESEKPAETEAPKESEKPAETEAPKESEKPAETEAPKESEKPAESEAPKESEKPAETPKPEDLKVLNKLTTTLDRTPVVLLAVSESHGTVSSKNATFVSLTWYDKGGNALPANSAFDYTTYRMEIRARADDGYIFSQNLAGYLNNSAATVSVSADGKYATVSREYEALVFAPRIIKHPGEETIDEGQFVSYVSTAAFATGLTWEFISPDGETVFDSNELTKTFRNSSCTNDGKEKIIIYNVPMEMNGWKVRAVFTGAQDTVTRSNPVTVKVNIDPNRETPPETEAPEESEVPEESEAPEVTEAPDATPEPEATPEPTATPAPEATPEPTEKPADSTHEHAFAAAWTADADEHWHECECGERSEVGAHDMRWKTLSVENGVASQEGCCSVCGYRESKQVTVSDTHIVNKLPMAYTVGGTLGLMLLLVIAESVKRGRRR